MPPLPLHWVVVVHFSPRMLAAPAGPPCRFAHTNHYRMPLYNLQTPITLYTPSMHLMHSQIFPIIYSQSCTKRPLKKRRGPGPGFFLTNTVSLLSIYHVQRIGPGFFGVIMFLYSQYIRIMHVENCSYQQ